MDDLRKQVKILQAVGYNSVEAEDWEIATRGDDIGKLETLLLDKNRRLEHELTQAKVGGLTWAECLTRVILVLVFVWGICRTQMFHHQSAAPKGTQESRARS